MFGTKELVHLFVERGASLQAILSGFTALHAAAMCARADIADTLIAFGVDVNTPLFPWGTPLHLAFSDMSDGLIVADEEPSIPFDSSSSIDQDLEHAAQLLAKVDEIVNGSLAIRRRKQQSEKRLRLIRLLVERGVDVNARRTDGTSVLHEALERDDPELVDFLVANGARDLESEASN